MPRDFIRNIGDPTIPEKLSPVFQKIVDMPFNYTPDEYNRLAVNGSAEFLGSAKVSEDVFLAGARKLIEGNLDSATRLDIKERMRKVLNRESMQKSPKRELFLEVMAEFF